jgi:tellurite resistance protein TerB
MNLMGFKDWLTTQKNSTVTSMKKFTNKDFMEAVAAGCAIIAFADGSVSSQEKQKMVGFINLNDALKVFNLSDVLARFNHHVQMFEFDLSVGKTEAMNTIAKLKKNPDAAKTLVTVCCAIGASDGNFDNKEIAVAKEICQALGLDPSQFELR